MTIHKAKGLDFGHVYVAQIHKGGRGGGKRAAAELRFFDGRPEYRLFGWATPAFASAEWVQDRKTRAEIVRLLYVATTRAKNRLVVSGGWRAPGDDVPPEAASTFARLDQPPSRGRSGGTSDRERGRTRRRRGGTRRAVDAGVRAAAGDGGTWSRSRGRRRSSRRGAASRERTGRRSPGRRGEDGADAIPFGVGRGPRPVATGRGRGGRAGKGRALSDRGLAMALGTAVHSMMETLDLASELAPQIAAQRERILGELGFDDDGDDGKGRAEDLLTRLAGGSCLARLSAVADYVVARELPVMLWSEEPGLPGAVVSGLVDLVYRDPDDGRVVVADYKTDRIDGAEALAERAGVYEPQVRTYASALRDALDLDHEPHVELWFLAADRIVRL